MSAIGKSVRKFFDKMVYRKALEATGGDKTFAAQLRDDTSATEDECEALGEVTDIILKELGLETKYLPLMAGVVMVVTAGGRYVICIKDLNRQIRIKQAKEAPLK